LMTPAIFLIILAVLSHLIVVRIYRWTVTGPSWYSETKNEARNLELHLRATRSGIIGKNRLVLGKVATRLYLRILRRRYGRRISPDRVKVRFERIEPGKGSSPTAQVVPIEFAFKGTKQTARRLASLTVPITRRRRRALTRRRLRSTEAKTRRRRRIRPSKRMN
jgi:hypothetical protein